MQQEEKTEAAGGAISPAQGEEAHDTGAAAGSYGGPADETEDTYETGDAGNAE